MINEKSFTKEWLDELRTKEGYEKAHPELMEKMNYALYLVEKLVDQNLKFTFKGGTCLILLLPELRRFSIDVDIITETKKEELEPLLDKIIEVSEFTKYKLDENRSGSKEFPKAHYDLYYTSKYDGAENSILLDVIFDEDQHTEIIETPINSEILSIDGESNNVKVPSIDAITGDKLTAFAPNTIGIGYGIGKGQQIIKQMYDVSKLIDGAINFKAIHESFEKVAKAQLSYFNKELKFEEILQDTIDTAFIFGMQTQNRDTAKEKYDELKSGVDSFKAFLPNPKYSTFDAIEDSSKAALLAAKLLMKNYDDFPRIEKKDFNPKKFQIENTKYKAIYKMIKGMPNLSVFYWYHISKLLDRS